MSSQPDERRRGRAEQAEQHGLAERGQRLRHGVAAAVLARPGVGGEQARDVDREEAAAVQRRGRGGRGRPRLRARPPPAGRRRGAASAAARRAITSARPPRRRPARCRAPARAARRRRRSPPPSVPNAATATTMNAMPDGVVEAGLALQDRARRASPAAAQRRVDRGRVGRRERHAAEIAELPGSPRAAPASAMPPAVTAVPGSPSATIGRASRRQAGPARREAALEQDGVERERADLLQLERREVADGLDARGARDDADGEERRRLRQPEPVRERAAASAAAAAARRRAARVEVGELGHGVPCCRPGFPAHPRDLRAT